MTRPRGWWKRAATAGVAVAAVGAMATGCGSSSSSGSGGGSAAVANVAAAKAAVAKFEKLPTSIGISNPITKPIPTGKTIIYINCGVPICNTYSDAMNKAAAVLGWTGKTLATDGTPGSVLNAWETAVRDHPAAVIGTGFNTTAYAGPLKQLKAMHIPVFNYSTTDPGPTGNVTARIGDAASVGQQGTQMAAWTVADGGNKTNTLFVDVPAYAILAGVKASFNTEYKKLCPNCPLGTLVLPITALGTNAGVQDVVSYLRSHPDVNHIAFSVDAASIGLPAALKSAGLSNVKFVGASGTVTNLGYIKAGQEGATVNQGYYEEMVALVDAAARSTVGLPTTATNSWHVPFWLVTKQSPGNDTTGFAPAVPNLYQQAAKLWGKSTS
jgi:ribose transport system substrate-binding protein